MKDSNMMHTFSLAPQHEVDAEMRKYLKDKEIEDAAEHERKNVELGRLRAKEADEKRTYRMLEERLMKQQAAAPHVGGADTRSRVTSSASFKTVPPSRSPNVPTVISPDTPNDVPELDEEIEAMLRKLEEPEGTLEQACKPKISRTSPSEATAQLAEKVPEAGVPMPAAPLVPTDDNSAPTLLSNSFPLDDEMSFERVIDPLRSMEELCFRLLSHKDYRRERREYCQLSIQINLSGKLAPAFRPELSLGAKYGDPLHKLLHRDRLVIDFHWCATHMDIHPNDVQYAALFAPGRAFSFGAAWALSGKSHKGQYRASEALMLTTFQQCQTHSLWGPELTARMGGVYSGYRDSGGKFASRHTTAKRKIREWVEMQPRMKPERYVYECLWDARELLGIENILLVARLLALMLGAAPLDRRTIKGKLTTLDKHVRL